MALSFEMGGQKTSVHFGGVRQDYLAVVGIKEVRLS